MIDKKEPAGGFWTFDSPREAYFDTPSHEMLNNAWQACNGEVKLLDMGDEVLGVCEDPQRTPSVVIALDLCEVVRGTAVSLARIRGGSIVDVISNSEHTVSDYASEFNGWNDKDRSKYITTMVQEFMHYDHVEPEPFHEAIAAFIRRWRENGAFVVADTSTLAGCEISTIKFLSEYYPGCFQGLLLPRNHDGTGSITKAMALDTAVIKLDANNLPIVLVEDTPHHALSFTQTFKDVHVFMPEYDWNKSVAGKDRITRIVRNFGTIDTFIATDKYLQTRGIIMDT